MMKPDIYIASDHRGWALKTVLTGWMRENGYTVTDMGPDSAARCDATPYAVACVRAMAAQPLARGVLICGTGQAMAMTANRFHHIRAALCANTTVARLTREHNDANVLVLGAAITGDEVALDCLKVFLSTDFLGGRYADRCRMLDDLGGL